MLDINFELPLMVFNIRDSDLSESEHRVLADIFTQPVVKKYLSILIANQIRDHAEVPLSTLAEDGLITSALKQAYIKGGLSMLYTLNSITKPQPTSVQATQQGQRTQT